MGEINDDGDTTDEEINDKNTNDDSDEEEDKPIFESDVEDSDNCEESEEDPSDKAETSEEDSVIESESNSESDSDNDSSKKIIEAKSKTDFKTIQKKNKNNSTDHKNSTSKFKLSHIKNNTNTDEYENDTSDEEDIRNTVGNIPMKWYNDSDHLGYDWDGKKILKPEKGDQLDSFLKRMEDPDFWRTIKDYQTGQDVLLSEADIELITRIQKQRVPDAQFDEYAVSKFILSLNYDT